MKLEVEEKYCLVTQLCPTLCDPMNCSKPGFPILHYLPEFAQTEVHWVNDAISPSHCLSPPSPPVLNLSQLRGFSNESAVHVRWPKHRSFSIRPSNEYSGLIYFRIDWFDLLAIQGTLKSLLQHRSSKAPILRHSVFFIVQLSHLYMTTGKTIALTIWTFVNKVMSLVYNTLFRFAASLRNASCSYSVNMYRAFLIYIIHWFNIL